MKNSVCLFCQREVECQNLKTLEAFFETFASSDLPESIQQDLQQFRQALQTYGYNYPEGEQICKLAPLKEEARQLIDRGQEILKRIYTCDTAS